MFERVTHLLVVSVSLFVCLITVGASFYPDPSIRFRTLHEKEFFDVLETLSLFFMEDEDSQKKCSLLDFEFPLNQGSYLIVDKRTNCHNA